MKKRLKAVISYPMDILRPVRDFLLKEKSRLKKVDEELEKEDPYNDPSRTNRNSLDDEVAEYASHDRVAALKRETRKSLIRIRKALTRIRVGKYGTCINCGQMIDTDRLAIKPTAEYCVACERKLEKVNGNGNGIAS